jgi:hypothetical protein
MPLGGAWSACQEFEIGAGLSSTGGYYVNMKLTYNMSWKLGIRD